MRTAGKILMSGLIAIALVMVSCQKEEVENEIAIEKNQEEGFNSETGNNDSKIDATSNILSPLLHKQYDANLSKEEASALFRSDVSKFEKENGDTARSSYFYFEIWTFTSRLPYSQSNGNTWARVNFSTDKGAKNIPWVRLNNEGPNRENGSWDFYYFGTHAPDISWLEAESAVLALQGTDGWHITYFDVRVWASKQLPWHNATGNSRAISNPEIWLDNSTSTGWDFYRTGNVGTGRMNFN